MVVFLLEQKSLREAPILKKQRLNRGLCSITMCLKWVENTRRKDLDDKEADILYRNYCLCGDHFEDSQFMNAQLKNSLVWNAIPTLFDVPDPPLSIAEEKANGCPLFPPSPARVGSDDDDYAILATRTMSTVPEAGLNSDLPSTAASDSNDLETGPPTRKGKLKLASAVLTPQQLRRIKLRQLANRQRVKIWRLKKQVQALKSRVKSYDTVEDIIQFASKHMSGVSLDFFANQLRMATIKNHGKRWSDEGKFFALILNCISVEAYRLCSKVFNLPSVRTLQRWLKCFRQVPEFGERLKAYKQKLLNSAVAATDEMIDAALLTNGEDVLLDESVLEAVMAATAGTSLPFPPNPQTVSVPRRRMRTDGASTQKKEKKSQLDLPIPEALELQLQSDRLNLDPQTFQFLADSGHLDDGTTFTAVQEVNEEGIVTLTPISNGVPVTLASDTINLEIVTLDVASEAINSLNFS